MPPLFLRTDELPGGRVGYVFSIAPGRRITFVVPRESIRADTLETVTLLVTQQFPEPRRTGVPES